MRLRGRSLGAFYMCFIFSGRLSGHQISPGGLFLSAVDSLQKRQKQHVKTLLTKRMLTHKLNVFVTNQSSSESSKYMSNHNVIGE